MRRGPRPNRRRRIKRRGLDFGRRTHRRWNSGRRPASSTASPQRCCAERVAGRRLSGASPSFLPAGFPIRRWGQAGSGGYSRPSTGPDRFRRAGRRSAAAAAISRPSASAPVFGGSSPGDRAMSRGQSSEALRNYRASQRPPPTYTPPAPTGSSAPPPASSGGGWLPGGGWGTAMPRRALPSGGGGRRLGYGQPAALVRYRRRNGVALWAALNALTSSPSQAEYFRGIAMTRPIRSGGRRPNAPPRAIPRWPPSSPNSTAAWRSSRRNRAAPAAVPPPGTRARAGRRGVLALGHRPRHRGHRSCCSGCGAAAPPIRACGAAVAAPGLAGFGRVALPGRAWCCRSIQRRFCSPPG